MRAYAYEINHLGLRQRSKVGIVTTPLRNETASQFIRPAQAEPSLKAVSQPVRCLWRHYDHGPSQIATIATALRRVVRCYSDNPPTSTFSLVGQNVQECRPPRVQNAFREMPTFDHALNVQVFHHN